MNGKGSRPRPVKGPQFRANYDAIFRKGPVQANTGLTYAKLMQVKAVMDKAERCHGKHQRRPS